jgi:c-di-GMP-related signal transduction protein
MAELVVLVELIEHADWQKSHQLIETLNIDKQQVAQFYNDALIWADEQLKLAD